MPNLRDFRQSASDPQLDGSGLFFISVDLDDTADPVRRKLLPRIAVRALAPAHMSIDCRAPFHDEVSTYEETTRA